MTNLSTQELAAFLQGFRSDRKILLATHVRPDGDALGSLCGLLLILLENGFDAAALLPGSVPDYYRPLLPEKGLITAEPSAEELQIYALMIVLDSATRDRVSADFFKKPGPLPQSIGIDHHPDNSGYCDLNHLVPAASATAEILYALADAARWKIGGEAATHLLIGILTDTGAFRFTNTSARTLRAAAALMDAGGDYTRIMNTCFFSKSENMALFEAELLCTGMKKACGGKFMYAYFTPELLAKYKIELRNTEQVIEILRSISGPVIVGVIRLENGGFKCSLRSKEKHYSVGRIARSLGGGGHEMASGCTITASSVEEAEAILVNHVEMELNEKQA
ncbi:MAG: Bifunctional oligoribonuclease and PAP phosphatase NrnA [Lentisphaerae bacterium ADurb.Bin242]|nr:MAG: Bifunctional oligoribonuclease and PAP phosphatase NrnA [Lentisphaerae bacterium ADurb.Bin242]